MAKMYTLSSIARKLSVSNRGGFVSEDAVWSWVKNGTIKAERVTDKVQNWGKHPYWVEESHLKEVLCEKGFDVDSLFPEVE